MPSSVLLVICRREGSRDSALQQLGREGITKKKSKTSSNNGSIRSAQHGRLTNSTAHDPDLRGMAFKVEFQLLSLKH